MTVQARPSTRGTFVSLALGLLMLAALAMPALAGSDKGAVIFRVTLTGPVDPDDHFVIWSRCPDEWCQPPRIPGVPTPDVYESSVVVCGRDLADHEVCSAKTYEWTLELIPGTLHYRFEREPDGANDPTGEGPSQILAEGSWEVHSGRQVLTFEYVYPSSSPGGQLPDTALGERSATAELPLGVPLVLTAAGASAWMTWRRSQQPVP